jgi:hypothetical protein
MKNAIGIKIYSHDAYKKGEPAQLIFEITNQTDKTLHILKWNTPLEGLQSPCLDIRSGKKQIIYDGIMKKRGLPQAKDFLTLKPNESATQKIDLTEAYDIAKTGSFTVNFDPAKFVYYADQPLADAITTSSFGFPKESGKLKIEMKPASFKVAGGKGKKLTTGAFHRNEELKKKPAVNIENFSAAATTGYLPCLIEAGTAAKKAKVRAAHKNGYELAKNALAGLVKDEAYTLWFGAYKKSRLAIVKKNYQKVIANLEKKVFTYNLSGTDCESGDYAYTFRGTTTIWFCDAFWAAPDKGKDSKAGTVVHEHTHASSYTDDIQYGEMGCQQLALSDPDEAVRNADSHEYYAGG